MTFSAFAAAGNFPLQPLDAVIRVQAKILCVGASKPNDVGAPRYRIEFAFLQGVQIVLADLQNVGDLRQIFTLAQPRFPQVLADGFQGGVGIIRYFTQMQTAAFEPAALIKGKSCDLWHIACCIGPVQALDARDPRH